jgi:hypothetical protein
MQLVFADDAVRQLCTTQELLVRTFGEMSRSVKLALMVIAAAESLADVAAFAALTVRKVRQTLEGLAEFDVRHAAVQLRLRATELIPVRTRDDDSVFGYVRAVSVLQVQLASVVVGA